MGQWDFSAHYVFRECLICKWLIAAKAREKEVSNADVTAYFYIIVMLLRMSHQCFRQCFSIFCCFYTSYKCQNISGCLTFSGGKEAVKYWKALTLIERLVWDVLKFKSDHWCLKYVKQKSTSNKEHMRIVV